MLFIKIIARINKPESFILNKPTEKWKDSMNSLKRRETNFQQFLQYIIISLYFTCLDR